MLPAWTALHPGGRRLRTRAPGRAADPRRGLVSYLSFREGRRLRPHALPPAALAQSVARLLRRSLGWPADAPELRQSSYVRPGPRTRRTQVTGPAPFPAAPAQ